MILTQYVATSFVETLRDCIRRSSACTRSAAHGNPLCIRCDQVVHYRNMEVKSLSLLSERLDAVSTQVSHTGTTGGARVQLQLVQEVEAALTGSCNCSDVKEVSHALMTSLLKMLENGLAGPVRAWWAVIAL
jgi:hypothetical protein